MSKYEANPAGLGVGQRYGARSIGGTNGTFVQNDSKVEIVYHLSADEPIVGVPMTATLPDNYLVESLYVEVEEAFAASSVADLSIDGGAGLTTDINLVTLGLSSVALTGLANQSGTGSVDIVLAGNSNAIASATGKARVVVQYAAI